ncbi:MAG: hypothetical protein U0904_01280 [Candidatus Nanopelagicales bacterium]|nr:hypothetical protein [Candidatus Nanopelagicales bacterium]
MHPNSDQIATFENELLDLVAQGASGRLIISGPDGDTGWVWLRDGHVCGVSSACRTPLLAARLAAFGVLSRAQIANALSATRTSPGTRLIDVLLSKRGVPEDFLTEFATATAGEHLAVALRQGVSSTRFENGRLPQTSTLLLPAMRVLEQAARYRDAAQPRQSRLLAVDTGAHEGLVTIQQAIVSSCVGDVDTVGIADRCGLTILEAVELVEPLIESGMILAIGRDSEERDVDLSTHPVMAAHGYGGDELAEQLAEAAADAGALANPESTTAETPPRAIRETASQGERDQPADQEPTSASARPPRGGLSNREVFRELHSLGTRVTEPAPDKEAPTKERADAKASDAKRRKRFGR